MRYLIILLLVSSCSAPPAHETALRPIAAKEHGPWTRTPIKKDLSADDENLIAFLEKPFDLYAFRQHSGANSGGYGIKDYYYKPAREGGFWYFFLFEPVYSENWMVMVTYKTKGPHYNDYIDPTEELIDVTLERNASNLPELSFIGESKEDIADRFGDDYFMNGEAMVYSRNERSLICYLKNSSVVKVRYAHFSQTLAPGSVIPPGPLEHK